MVIFKYLLRLLIAAASFVVILFFVAFLIDPRAIWIIGFLQSQPWRDECRVEQVGTYLGGSHIPCSESPITHSNSNERINGYGPCPLEFTIRWGSIAKIEELISKGSDPKLCPGYPDSLTDAFADNACSAHAGEDKKLMRLLLKEGIKPSNPQEFLFLSTRRRCELGMRWAVSLGASVDAKDSHNRTPLEYVVNLGSEGQHLSAVLISLGADPSLAIASGDVTLEQAQSLPGSAEPIEKILNDLN